MSCGLTTLPTLDKSALETLSAYRTYQNSFRSTNVCSIESDSSCEQNEEVLQISYLDSPLTLITGDTIVNVSPTVIGSPTRYSVSPDLPFGLHLNNTTGVISGKISEILINATYTITASTNTINSNTILSISSTVPTPCSDVSITQGVGTNIDPFIICNPYQLQSMSTHHISNPGAHYRLTQDIDLSVIANFTPISNITNQFSGVFDGQNHTLHNLTINTPASSHQGLFGYVIGGSSSEIRNLRLSAAKVIGNAQTGSLIGLLNATARNIHSINGYAESFSTASGTGGLVGRLSSNGSIYDSSFSGNVKGGSQYAGGIVGDSFNGIEIVRCKASGTIMGGSTVGGIIGRAASTPIINSYWIGSVTGGSEVGGLIGLGALSTGVPRFSYSVGVVSGSSLVGGAMGVVAGTVIESYYNIDVATQTDNDTRGIPKTTLELKCPVVPNDPCATNPIYSTWDTGIWDFRTSSEYPKLVWESTI